MDDRQLFTIVARKVPVIWNAVGPASLNPQPLPPDPDELYSPLNPQPLPPGPPPELYGVAVGQELLRISYQAEVLGYGAGSAAADDAGGAGGAGGTGRGGSLLDQVATPAGVPIIPPHLPQVVEPNQAWLEGYYLGLACALAMGTPSAPTPGEAAATASGSTASQLLAQAVAALAQVTATPPPTTG